MDVVFLFKDLSETVIKYQKLCQKQHIIQDENLVLLQSLPTSA